jgi:hypothetical protein
MRDIAYSIQDLLSITLIFRILIDVRQHRTVFAKVPKNLIRYGFKNNFNGSSK